MDCCSVCLMSRQATELEIFWVCTPAQVNGFATEQGMQGVQVSTPAAEQGMWGVQASTPATEQGMRGVQASTPALAAPLQCHIAPAAPCLVLPGCPEAALAAPGQLPSTCSLAGSTMATGSSTSGCCTTSGALLTCSPGAPNAAAAGCTSLRAWIWAPCGAELQGWHPQQAGPSTSSDDGSGRDSGGSGSKPPVLRALACTDTAYLATQVISIERCPRPKDGDQPPAIANGQELFEVRIKWVHFWSWMVVCLCCGGGADWKPTCAKLRAHRSQSGHCFCYKKRLCTHTHTLM